MYPEPTGRVIRSGPDAYDLILNRPFTQSPQTIWASFTQPAEAALWFGRWDGRPGPGETVDVQMLYETNQPFGSFQLQECVPGERLRVSAEDEYGSWDLEVNLTGSAGGSAVEFIQHLEDLATVESTGPGWEFYLDRLGAVHGDGILPDFSNYYPAQGPYYAAQAQAAAESGAGS
ncbi:SRPBCC domain-containing protein [Arthrobacter sp. 7Tela_A1]|uniref:SRPBCC domain-containing protein n=1 Tax=Arthrobacter sp. 7Tela_A1 TaxID=3093745 RepID=UPI003BB7DD30